MWQLLLCVAVLVQSSHVWSRCIDCAFGMCDTGPQFCDEAKQECVCPEKKNRNLSDLIREGKCIDCARIHCDTGPQICDFTEEKCICPRGGRIPGESSNNKNIASLSDLIGQGKCIDCARIRCDTGPQICDFTLERCTCPKGGKIPGEPSSSDTSSFEHLHISSGSCIDCAHNMCDTGPQRCDTATQKCVCPDGGKIPSV